MRPRSCVKHERGRTVFLTSFDLVFYDCMKAAAGKILPAADFVPVFDFSDFVYGGEQARGIVRQKCPFGISAEGQT